MRRIERVIKKGVDRNGKPFEVKRLNRGLKKIHIGGEVWVYGRQSNVNGKAHMVIYGPNRKEYHVWGSDVNDLCKTNDSWYYDEWGYGDRNGNRAIESKVKIHVLTSILDERSNWCFDLKTTPKNGFLKVIYDNGTVKNIEFDGEFKKVEVKKSYGYTYSIKPIGYRLK